MLINKDELVVIRFGVNKPIGWSFSLLNACFVISLDDVNYTSVLGSVGTAVFCTGLFLRLI